MKPVKSEAPHPNELVIYVLQKSRDRIARLRGHVVQKGCSVYAESGIEASVDLLYGGALQGSGSVESPVYREAARRLRDTIGKMGESGKAICSITGEPFGVIILWSREVSKKEFLKAYDRAIAKARSEGGAR